MIAWANEVRCIKKRSNWLHTYHQRADDVDDDGVLIKFSLVNQSNQSDYWFDVKNRIELK